ncbi:hypothetical protein QR685DRAFT_597838 [Neurospora intermedia]|uniref:Zn(2)-C6 fungal-type domain-containing protein n=1 Tax=Neurospora intermedia TaxID=5142 RepID=A0ABR3D9I3_NEUIN
MSGNQQGDLPQFEVNQVPMISGAQPGESPKFGDDETPTGNMYESQQGQLPQFDPNEMPGLYENQPGELQHFDVNQAPMLFGDQQGVLLQQFDANQMPTGSMYESQQGDLQQFDANQALVLFYDQQGQLQQFDANQMPTGSMYESQQGELQQFDANQMPTGSMSGSQQGESPLSPANQVPTTSGNQQGESSLSPANQMPTMSSNQQGELPQVNANQRSMMFGSQQGESSLSPANQAPLGATSAQGGQGAKQSATIEYMMATLTHLAAKCEGIETTLPMDVYRQVQKDYKGLVSTVQAKIDLSREPVPQPILEASIRIESRLMHHTPVDDVVASPVLGRLAAPPCQLESRKSVAMAQTVATLNQAFPLPCRSCTGTGTACQRSFIDEKCAFCKGSNQKCLTNYPVNIVSGGSAGPAANTGRVMANLFQEHRKGVLDVVQSRVRDTTRLSLRFPLGAAVYLNIASFQTWLHCSIEMDLAQNPPAWMEASRGWAVRECIQGRLSRMKLMARDTPRIFSSRMGDCPEQRLEIRNTVLIPLPQIESLSSSLTNSFFALQLVTLLSFCNINAGYICSAQSYLALAHREFLCEFLRANDHVVDQGFVKI